MKKLLLLLMALFMMVFCFAACGSDDEDADVDEESSVSDEVDEDEDSEAEDSDTDEDSESEDSDTDEESGASSLYVGTWKLSYIIDSDGNELTIEEYYTAIGQADAYTEEAADVSFTFNDDGTGVATVAGVDQDLTWTVDDSNIITYTTSAGTSSTLAFNGEDAMTYEDESSGYTSVYEKQ